MTRWISALVLASLLTLGATLRADAPSQSPFALRGFKGLWWDGLEKYRLAVPWAAAHDMNFVMLCYSSFPASGKDWRADYTPAELAGLKELTAEADRLHVELCLSFNPGIWSKPPLTYGDEADYQLALRKVRMVHDAGIHSFSLCLDDINTQLQPTDAERFKDLGHCQMYFVNRLYADIKKLDPAARFIFCPSAYTTEEADKHADYTKVVGDGLDPGVQIFWTGPTVCSPSITAADADHMTAVYHRKPIVWDNYPVNDMFPWRPLLAPVKNRSADLASHVDGLMANPMKQWHASTIPLSTLADYFSDPAGYDPAKALTHALEAYDSKQRPTVAKLAAAYGSKFLGEPNYPPNPAAGRADAMERLTQLNSLRAALSNDAVLAPLWRDVQPTFDADLAVVSRLARDRKKDSPLNANGDDFAGGAAERYGFDKYGRQVNYVYATPTKHDRMSVDFYVFADVAKAAVVKLTARDDDSGKPVRIRITLNDHSIFEGISGFSATGFSARPFDVPAGTLHAGANHLVIENLESTGVIGMPPWFMVAAAELKL